jgi:hypothetical protein
MIERYVAPISRDVLQRNGRISIAARCDHDAELPACNDIRCRGPEIRGEDSIVRRRCSAAQHMAEDGDP